MPKPERPRHPYTLLGKSGLRVSPFALGTMTFGTEWGWGAEKSVAFSLLDLYLERGGNFLDTADAYTNGTSESILGEYLEAKGCRDRVVLATKYTFNTQPGNPNAGGNGRKNLLRALEGSLRRLRTDYVDLLWMHAWDSLTPVEEVVASLDALVRQGKVRYLGFSDVPAWWLARAQTLCEWRGWERACGLQLEYSLVERNLEREHLPAARELGLGLTPWSPLGSGLLSGKYRREGTAARGSGRLEAVQGRGNPAYEKLFTERNWRIVDVLLDVARELGQPPAAVALAWVMNRPGVTSTILGASRVEQLAENLAAAALTLPPALEQRLEEASRPEVIHPYHFSEPVMRNAIDGGQDVRRERGRTT